MRYRVLALFLVSAAFFHNGGLLLADNWKTVAVRDARLGPLQIARLAKNKMLITDQQCSQIFQPYVEPEMSVFITSDSILNAYHVLLEESVLRLEMANANELGEVLHFIWTNLDSADREVQGDRPLVEAARRRARIVVGTALRLLDHEIPQADEATAAAINGQVERVEKAEGLFKPAWLGAADEPDLLAIDYSRFKPRGFYTANEALSRYFRAVSWLQAIPFRAEKDEELLAILLLGDCLTPERFADDKKKQQQYAGFFDRCREFLGERDDWDLTKAAAVVGGELKLDLAAGQLARIREALKTEAARDGQRPQINDQIAYPGESGPSFRILSAYRTPDSVLFQKTLNPREFLRPFPTGLEVCIALGSSYAAHCLDDPQRDKLIATIEQSKGLFVGTSLGAGYYECLSTLFDAPPAGAPPFMASDVWQAKSCQTALAGWAQWRHTWVLQNKQVFYYLCEEDKDKPVGFVEPNPAFFRRMRELADRTASMFEQVKPQDPRVMYAIVDLENLVRVLESKVKSGESLDYEKPSSREEELACDTLMDLMKMRRRDMEGPVTTQFLSEALAKVKETLHSARCGELSDDFLKGRGWARSVEGPLHTL